MSRRAGRPGIDYDVVVAGAGVAGIRTAGLLHQAGFRTALCDPNFLNPDEKALFVDTTKLPAGLFDGLPTHQINTHNLVNTDDVGRNWGETGDFSMVGCEYLPLHERLREGLPKGVEVIEGKIIGSRENGRVSMTLLENGKKQKPLTCRQLVDASGDNSPVSRRHVNEVCGKPALDDNPLVMWMAGVRGEGEFQPGIIYDPIGREIGCVSWVTPLGATRGDIVAAGYSRLSDLDFSGYEKVREKLIETCRKYVICDLKIPEKYMSGIIRSEPVSARQVKRSARLWQIGQAAGMADPLMAEAFPPAFVWPEVMVKMMAEGKRPIDFFNQWRYRRPMFNYGPMLAMLYNRRKYELEGRVGTNAAIYQTLTEELSDEAAIRAVRNRTIPWIGLIRMAARTFTNRELRNVLGELTVQYIKILAKDNFFTRAVGWA